MIKKPQEQSMDASNIQDFDMNWSTLIDMKNDTLHFILLRSFQGKCQFEGRLVTGRDIRYIKYSEFKGSSIKVTNGWILDHKNRVHSMFWTFNRNAQTVISKQVLSLAMELLDREGQLVVKLVAPNVIMLQWRLNTLLRNLDLSGFETEIFGVIKSQVGRCLVSWHCSGAFDLIVRFFSWSWGRKKTFLTRLGLMFGLGPFTEAIVIAKIK